jgi:hypothetical protein
MDETIRKGDRVLVDGQILVATSDENNKKFTASRGARGNAVMVPVSDARLLSPDVEQRLGAITALERFKNQFDDLIGMLDELPLSPARAKRAKEALKQLKTDLAGTVRTIRKNIGGNLYDRHCVEPTLYEAAADITVTAASTPNETWRSNLEEAKVRITHMLAELRRSGAT